MLSVHCWLNLSSNTSELHSKSIFYAISTHIGAIVARLEAQPASVMHICGAFGGFEKYLFTAARCIWVVSVVLELRKAVLHILQMSSRQGQFQRNFSIDAWMTFMKRLLKIKHLLLWTLRRVVIIQRLIEHCTFRKRNVAGISTTLCFVIL